MDNPVQEEESPSGTAGLQPVDQGQLRAHRVQAEGHGGVRILLPRGGEDPGQTHGRGRARGLFRVG